MDAELTGAHKARRAVGPRSGGHTRSVRRVFAMSAVVAASCLLATGCDPGGTVRVRLINGCDHEVSVRMSESGGQLTEEEYVDGLRPGAVPLEPGETSDLWPIQGQTIAADVIIFSDTDYVQFAWGEGIDKPNEYTLSGAECLSPMSHYGQVQPSAPSPTE